MVRVPKSTNLRIDFSRVKSYPFNYDYVVSFALDLLNTFRLDGLRV